MKKVVYACMVALLALNVNIMTTHAQSSNNHDTKGQEQAVDQLLLDLFNQEIDDAVANYYKEDSINYQYNWWDKDYDVVEVDQTEKGHVLEYVHNGKKQQFAYVVKFTVQPQKDKVLGTDTITFGVQQDANLEPKIKMLSYDHSEPKNE
ncbi:DUF3888 domain-containing protein [Halobacillus amylolyticus]|uniref:DUF3888 domain-containing protein n=1 Tax=Halobacillus amylolyticus TaxID=2932259 RepID=A0ABY4HGF9_9BACI|nr:DUF3888 domain-containing protein [Halobacillus amylolyticus]UOR13714.1 DUF3888 domain-containing protein [Halobacillus amylolyticus]